MTMETEGSSSRGRPIESNLGGSEITILEIKEKSVDQSKFKKVEMLVFNGDDLDAWLFRANRFLRSMT